MSPIRVLVAEDDPVDRALLVRVLTRAGMEPVTAGDGAEALALLKAQPGAFDVLLLDLAMPRIDGMELLKRVKEAPRLRHLPVILQTATHSPDAIAEGLRNGAYHYLTKPLTQKILVAVVRSAADFSQRHRDLIHEADKPGAAMALVQEASFRFQTLAECHDLANLLARICPHPAQIAPGLSELLINALEHGNLGISYKDKTELLDGNAWKAEVLRRQQLPENRDKWVQVQVKRLPDRIRFEIQDEGPGFDWQAFVVPCPSRVFDNHGRGIFMATIDCFDRVEYPGNGSRVVADVRLEP